MSEFRGYMRQVRIVTTLLPMLMFILLGGIPCVGEAAGPYLVKDIMTTGSSNVGELTNVNGTLFFSADDGVHGYELWRSDGTEAGTVLVRDINPGAAQSGPGWLTDANGTLFFKCSDGVLIGLCKSDGTGAGTVLVKGSVLGEPHWLNPLFLMNVNGTIFFVGNDEAHGQELWRSDGTEAGTVLVRDINPGPNLSLPGNLDYMTNVNGMLFFSAFIDVNIGLWRSDGTEAGTVLVKGGVPGGSYNPVWLTNVDGTLFFFADNGLWRSDGTESGTILVKNLDLGALSSSWGLVNVNRTLFFAHFDGVHGWELWKSDGFEAGTVPVKVVNNSVGLSWQNPLVYSLANVDGTLFFLADDGVHGYELWRSDGSEAGTVLVKDINPGAGPSVYPYAHLVNVNGTLFFGADDGVYGYELWAYVPGPFALTVTKQGAGSGIITSVPEGIGCGKTCGASFPENTTVTLAAVPEAGSLFAGWTGCDSVAGEQCLVTMSAPRTVTAMFTSAPLTTLTVHKEGAGIGTVRSVPGGIICGDECSNTYDPGTSVTLSATPEPGYAFMGWSGGGCSGKEDCTVTLWDSMVVSARFDCSLPLPTRQEVFAYDAVRVPKMVCNASDLKPIGVGLAADGKPWFSLAVNMPGFEEKVDYYLAFYAPDIDAQNVYLMRPDGSLAPLKGGLTLWMEGVESPVMNMPWAEMGYFFGINVPLGQYHAALLVTPQGALMGPYYVWITSFRVK